MAPGQYSLNPNEHTLSPIVTGGTIVGIKYNGGVLLAGDTLCSYGSSARYKDVCRMRPVGKYTMLGCTGEYSDFQYLGDMLDEMDVEEYVHEDGCSMGPKQYSSYIGRVMYNRRSKFNPLYNQFVVVGKKNDEAPFLAFCDHQGTYFEENYYATGMGNHVGMPLLREEWKADMTFDQAKALAIKVLQVCFYRSCRAFCDIHIGKCDATGVSISEKTPMSHFWGHDLWLEKRLEGGVEMGSTW
eukprot:TRINITY_DN2996_c0_g1_i2.p2 TRINITY_DN2996_c0_g1~~TRINITY_DN2996_c0_g1_i2.p2  ORF type:complete len:269 (+),score=69.18 TRINITY_DN2996_c0_g1_i2:82-807(+)